MTDHDKNMRTLIVSFVVAMMVMVPLRFVESTQFTLDQTTQVLGEMTAAPKTERVIEAKSILEAPYDEIEAGVVSTCISIKESENQIKAVIDSYGGTLNNLNEEETAIAYNEIKAIDDKICR